MDLSFIVPTTVKELDAREPFFSFMDFSSREALTLFQR